MTVNKNQIEIPVVFITDNNYVLPTAVAITSLVRNKKRKTIYKIYVIVTEDVTIKNKRKLTKCGKRKAKVNLIFCDSDVLKEYAVHGYYVLPCALLKFNIPGLLPQYEKILYIDGDILVNNDLSELYNTDISQVYLAAVSDIAAIEACGYHKRLGIDNYFNAGVMLLNSARMRQEGFEEKLYRIKRQNPDYICMDQDVFNVAVQDKAVFLPVKYNVMLYNFMHPSCGGITKLNEHYGTSYESFDSVAKDAVIVHLTNEYKPWKYKDAVMHKKWISYFKKSPFRSQKLSLAYLIPKETISKKMSWVYTITRDFIKQIIKKFIKKLPVVKQLWRRYTDLKHCIYENNIILNDNNRILKNIECEIRKRNSGDLERQLERLTTWELVKSRENIKSMEQEIRSIDENTF
jgi:lipopolysaccharide biosynthesis glycosyltransferase